MRVHYNLFASQNLERLAALSDGIFAIAMTLLILDLHIPVQEIIHLNTPLWGNGAIQAEQSLWNALIKLWPSVLTYLMSFLTLGIFWVAQQTQLNHFTRSDRHLTWIHLTFLLAVSLMPFSTALLSAFITFRLALVLYWLNLLLLGVMLYSSLCYAEHASLVKEESSPDVLLVNKRRIIVWQLLYLGALLLCVFNTYISIVCLILMQLTSALGIQIGPLKRI